MPTGKRILFVTLAGMFCLTVLISFSSCFHFQPVLATEENLIVGKTWRAVVSDETTEIHRAIFTIPNQDGEEKDQLITDRDAIRELIRCLRDFAPHITEEVDFPELDQREAERIRTPESRNYGVLYLQTEAPVRRGEVATLQVELREEGVAVMIIYDTGNRTVWFRTDKNPQETIRQMEQICRSVS